MVIHDADLEALPLPTKRVIEVVGFIDETDVDPLLYARPYWVGAHGPGAQKPYALLVEALARSGAWRCARWPSGRGSGCPCCGRARESW
ncbi:hypothetical protein IPZ61_03910 [Streptomyces sioyaensis]|uniref:Ku protein n=1 Tax=Streptomyces sioyaensis TaxID=67364 RepID=UPI001F277A64|nr:Ku protein [Streptomyces sioyaensis]MCF3172473.1 hypothetical protein [Streptomyces sioyaensis]